MKAVVSKLNTVLRMRRAAGGIHTQPQQEFDPSNVGTGARAVTLSTSLTRRQREEAMVGWMLCVCVCVCLRLWL